MQSYSPVLGVLLWSRASQHWGVHSWWKPGQVSLLCSAWLSCWALLCQGSKAGLKCPPAKSAPTQCSHPERCMEANSCNSWKGGHDKPETSCLLLWTDQGTKTSVPQQLGKYLKYNAQVCGMWLHRRAHHLMQPKKVGTTLLLTSSTAPDSGGWNSRMPDPEKLCHKDKKSKQPRQIWRLEWKCPHCSDHLMPFYFFFPFWRELLCEQTEPLFSCWSSWRQRSSTSLQPKAMWKS